MRKDHHKATWFTAPSGARGAGRLVSLQPSGTMSSRIRTEREREPSGRASRENYGVSEHGGATVGSVHTIPNG